MSGSITVETVGIQQLASSPLILQVRAADPASRQGVKGERWVGRYARFVVVAALKPADPAWIGTVVELPVVDPPGDPMDHVQLVVQPEPAKGPPPPGANDAEFLIFAEVDPTLERRAVLKPGCPIRYARGELSLPLWRRDEILRRF